MKYDFLKIFEINNIYIDDKTSDELKNFLNTFNLEKMFKK